MTPSYSPVPETHSPKGRETNPLPRRRMRGHKYYQDFDRVQTRPGALDYDNEDDGVDGVDGPWHLLFGFSPTTIDSDWICDHLWLPVSRRPLSTSSSLTCQQRQPQTRTTAKLCCYYDAMRLWFLCSSSWGVLFLSFFHLSLRVFSFVF